MNLDKPHFKYRIRDRRWYCYMFFYPDDATMIPICGGDTFSECVGRYVRLATGMTA